MNSDICSCNRYPLFLSQVTAHFNSGGCISEGNKDVFFGTMTSVWKLFYYYSQKAEALKGIQAFLGFPELKIMKPSDTRWLSREHCVKEICKELPPPWLLTLSQLYESSGDAEAHGIYSLLASGVSSSCLLSEVLNALALINLFMQKKIADFCKLPFKLKNTLDHLNSIRESDTIWCSTAETAISNLETEHGITIKGSRGPTVRKSSPL